MRTASSISAVLLALLVQAPVQALESEAARPSPPTRPSIRGAKTPLDVCLPSGTKLALRVERDASVRSGSSPIAVEVVGEVADAAVVFIDTYPSLPGGMSYCQAGEERFLRVFSIAERPPRETYRVKLASCRDNIELADRGVEWLPETATLRIHWLPGSAPKGVADGISVVIGRDGKPR